MKSALFHTATIKKSKQPHNKGKLEMSNEIAALPNIGGALCSTPQTLADAHHYSAVQ